MKNQKKMKNRGNKVVVAICLVVGIMGGGPLKGAPKVLDGLDADQNGLYDDVERKAMLDAIVKECPSLTDNFDADNDGKVTIQEQHAGRGPLSFLIPVQNILESEDKIPWTPDLFPEWISSAYLQEDVALGAVAEHRPRGTVEKIAAQLDQDLRPGKKVERGGVEFAANSGQRLLVPGERDARWDYRWCLLSFRIDASSGTDNETVLLDLNRGEGSNRSSPKIWYDRQTGLNIQYVGLNQGGLDRRVMTAKNVIADGKTWNVVVCGIRYGQMFASVNGTPLSTVAKQPPRFSGESPQDSTTYIGGLEKGNMAWAYDTLAFGLTEPSEEMVCKMTGWAAHRLGFQSNLPDGHPYKSARPVLDAEDFPHRYFHDDEKWNAWGAALKTNREADRANAGGERLEPKGFERVFYDDFRIPRVKASTSGEGDLWVGPGFNTSVGCDAQLVTPGQQPDVYPYDATNKKQILSLVKQGDHWRGSAFYSVNDLGHGYAWAGPKVFRIRCMFPKVDPKSLTPGLFPAFWSYAPDNILWRTGNRIEVDWFEIDGQNGQWLNGLSTHFHYAYFKDNMFAKNPKSYKRYKVFGGPLTEEASKISGGIFFWDGKFHTWEFVVDQDTTYINITIPDANGQDKWVEVCRAPTAPTYLERLDLQLDYALRGKKAPPEYAHLGNKISQPKTDARQDFVVDSIEVLQKTSAISSVPQPFTARPSLSGGATAGSTLTCEPNVKDITDVRYFWFADGYPLTYGPDNTYTITSAEEGKAIRCMVKAVGARDMPEAWSNVLNPTH